MTPPRQVKYRWMFAMLATVATIAAACTVPRDDQARPIDPSRLVSSASNKINCASPGVDVPSTVLHVFLVSQNADPPFVTSVERVVSTPAATPRAALDALFNCRVTDEDRRNGLATDIPEETQLLGLDPIADRTGFYEVRIGRLQNRGAQKVNDLDKVAVAQIFFTAADAGLAQHVLGLQFSIDGRAVAVTTDRGTVSQSDFVCREDFLASSPSSATTRTTPPLGRPSTSITVTPRCQES